MSDKPYGICRVCSSPLPAGKTRPPTVYCSPPCRAQGVRDRVKKAQKKKVKGLRNLRRPLPDFANDTAWSLRKDMERFERIFDDDRFPAHKRQVAARVRGHLEYAAEVCQDLLSRLNHTGE